MSERIVLAVDGGNSKTDLALAREDGSLLALIRGPLSSPYHIGVEGSLDVMQRLLDEALAQAGIERRLGPVADVSYVCLAGVDFPAEEDELQRVIATRGWAERTYVLNDTFAVLRAGTDRGWGVAVVCGAGINCVGVSPDGRHSRFPALGVITGDWGGGHDVGLAAVSAAARSEDGRGQKTSLERAVPAHFGVETPSALAEAIHVGRISSRRVIELAPVVFAQAAHDAVAAEIVHKLAAEVVALARVSLVRLDLLDEPVEVLLGGGLLRAGDGRLLAAIDAGLQAVAPAAIVRPTASPPIGGAVLLGLDELGAGPDAQARLREELAIAGRELEASTPAVDAEEEDYGFLEVE